MKTGKKTELKFHWFSTLLLYRILLNRCGSIPPSLIDQHETLMNTKTKEKYFLYGLSRRLQKWVERTMRSSCRHFLHDQGTISFNTAMTVGGTFSWRHVQWHDHQWWNELGHVPSGRLQPHREGRGSTSWTSDRWRKHSAWIQEAPQPSNNAMGQMYAADPPDQGIINPKRVTDSGKNSWKEQITIRLFYQKQFKHLE